MKTIHNGISKKGNPFIIRPIKLGDEKDMLKYINTLSKEKTYITFQGEQLSLKEEKEYVKALLRKVKKKEAVSFLVYVRDELAGVAEIETRPRAENHVGIFGISMAKKYRNEGIGTIYAKFLIEEAIKKIPQLKIITLTVLANNKIAQKLYKNLGFKECGRLPKGVRYKNTLVDVILMYKKI